MPLKSSAPMTTFQTPLLLSLNGVASHRNVFEFDKRIRLFRRTANRSSSRRPQAIMMKFREECGVVGVWGTPDAPVLAYYALHALQHRGQEGAGIVVSDQGNEMREVKGLGLVSDVLAGLSVKGNAAIAHNRYSTSGEKSVRNVQPFRAHFRDGPVALAHNGNLTNADALRRELELRGSIFATSSDTEVILHLMATSVVAAGNGSFALKAADALGRVQGAYSLILLTPGSLIAVRDPYGFRPLVLGEIASHDERVPPAFVFASETCALDIVDAKYVREVEPGEMVEVRPDGQMQSSYPFAGVMRRACVFEHVYFARPSSVVFSRSVYMSRFRFGELLAESSPVVNADLVVAVPESGVPAALGFASASGVPFQQAIVRSHYVGRTFIQPTQRMRDIGVRLKLAPVEALIKGKSVVVVDDSIVRGTTSKKIVTMLREAGAREVHMRIACPPITGSCFYGVDTPDREQLISFTKNEQQVCQHVGADTLAFLPLHLMHHFLADEAPTYCDACFSGSYPVLPPGFVVEAPPSAAHHIPK